MPPKIAFTQVVVIVPFIKVKKANPVIDGKAAALMAGLKSKGISVKYDNRDNRPDGNLQIWTERRTRKNRHGL